MLDGENRPAQCNTTQGRLQGSDTLAATDKTQVPAFQFSVLTCARRSQLATKIVHADGKETPYSLVKYFHYKYCELDSLDDFAKIALTWLADEPNRFIIRGQLKPGLRGPQRRLLYPKDNEPATIDCPPRRWIPLDIDGVEVPAGLGAPDKLAEAAYHIRDNILPSYFRGVRCVASATASTGRKGPCTARLRLFFELAEAADNNALWNWVEGLSARNIFIDPSVMRAMQPIYTARPWFRGCKDPVPEWGRMRVLDGYEDQLEFEMPPKKRGGAHGHDSNGGSWLPEKPQYVVPEELLEITAQDAGLGVPPLPEEISDKAWGAIKQIFDLLDGQPKGGMGRHEALNRGAWQLARLVAECELPQTKAREAFLSAAEGINNNDGKYDVTLIERHIDDAFDDVCRR
jgi:hypothetical protein